jgi:hypothetical protein
MELIELAVDERRGMYLDEDALGGQSWLVRGDSGRGDRAVGVLADSKLSLAFGFDMVATGEELRLVKEAWGKRASSEVVGGYRLLMV